MNFTDIFIRRPVLASVISLLILVLGVRAYYALPVLQYPRTENAVVTVTTTYYGADPDVVAGFITTPLENAIAQANGIDYMTSTSQSSASTITVYLRLNYDADKALTEINTKINSVLNQLPTGTQQPVLTVKIGQTIDAMYIGFNSDALAPNQITDYLVRVVQPKLQAVPGVQTAEMLGQKVFALRAWLDPQKLAAFGLTATDVSAGACRQRLHLRHRQHQGPDGAGQPDRIDRPAFGRGIPQSGHQATNGAVVRLKDVANVTLGAEDYESEVGFDGKQAVYIGIQVAPAANLLDVVARRAQGLSRHPGAVAARAQRRDHLRLHRVRELPRSTRSCCSLVEALAIVTARRVHVPRLGAFVADPDRRHSAVAGRHIHRSCWRSAIRSIC